MERRKFLIGVGSASIGGSALLGSGAFTRVESQRRVKVEVAEDPDAYLGLDGCEGSPNQSYTEIDDSGHLAVEMSPDNPTEAGGQGVNSDSFTWFDDVFQICNQGKQAVCIWMEAEPNPELPDPPEEYEDEPRVVLYNGEQDNLLTGPDQSFTLGVGECKCVGIRTMTKGLETGDQLLENDEVVIHADADADCERDAVCADLEAEYTCTLEDDGQVVGTRHLVTNNGDDSTDFGWAVINSPNDYADGVRTVAALDTNTFTADASGPEDGIVWWEDEDGCEEELMTYADFRATRGEADDLIDYIENDTAGIPDDAFVVEIDGYPVTDENEVICNGDGNGDEENDTND